tara:strand:+ start:3285 stop:5234 length:1950 start_codon:yes stop_codon:yes gene_type:complete
VKATFKDIEHPMAHEDATPTVRPNEQHDLLRISTAGSVDDGKSTLIGRLLHECKSIYDDHYKSMINDSKKWNRDGMDYALLLDGLKAEREQGITIDVAYRFFSTPNRHFIVADTPGHEQYTRNMATGASTADLAIILVDASKGLLPQSRLHASIASLLGIKRAVVAVNKMDLVGYKQKYFRDIEQSFRSFAEKLNFTDVRFIPMSALKGDNVVKKSKAMPWYEGTALLPYLESLYIGSDRNLIDLRFPVQYVNRPTADFRGYCGTVESGVIRRGDAIMVLPSGKETKVKSLVTMDGELDYAYPHQAITVCLEDEIDISRGNILVHPGNVPKIDRQVEANVVWMSEEPLDITKKYLLRQNTNEVRAVVSNVKYQIDTNTLHRKESDTLQLNQVGQLSIECFKPLAYDAYEQNRKTGAFILIDPVTYNTVAAGMLLDKQNATSLFSDDGTQEPVANNIYRYNGAVTSSDRQGALGQKASCLWLTGLSGAGKSTVAYALEEELLRQHVHPYVLDGDNVRHGLNRDLGFSPEERRENIRRVAETARLMMDAGLVVICSFISPFKEDREMARKIIGDRFFEVHVDASLETCESRDPKGLYQKARNGEIANFTGVSAPYEAPSNPDLVLNNDRDATLDGAVSRLMDFLKQHKIQV